jgi:hypothetical protein
MLLNIGVSRQANKQHRFGERWELSGQFISYKTTYTHF